MQAGIVEVIPDYSRYRICGLWPDFTCPITAATSANVHSLPTPRPRSLPFPTPTGFRLFSVDFDAAFFQIESKLGEDSHINVSNPHQRKSSDQVAAPVGKQKFVAGNDESGHRHVMAEAVFTGKNIKELSFRDLAAYLAFGNTVIPKFPHYFFMR